jgi:hypothetical protein
MENPNYHLILATPCFTFFGAPITLVTAAPKSGKQESETADMSNYYMNRSEAILSAMNFPLFVRVRIPPFSERQFCEI